MLKLSRNFPAKRDFFAYSVRIKVASLQAGKQSILIRENQFRDINEASSEANKSSDGGAYPGLKNDAYFSPEIFFGKCKT